MHACVTEAHATVNVCVHMPKECVGDRKEAHVHAAEDGSRSEEKEFF